jgi:hypothetical protein
LPGRDGGKIRMISEKEKENYFCRQGWTNGSASEMAKTDLPVGQISCLKAAEDTLRFTDQRWTLC